MKSLDFARCAISISVAVALLTGCGGSQPPIGAPGAMPQTAALATRVRPSYGVLYSFKGYGDGEYPAAGLINVNGTLYGTTHDGGGQGCYYPLGCGTVYSITTSGTESVLHSFAGNRDDGEYPVAGLLNLNGTLYGTTRNGGGEHCNGYGCGTIFSVTTLGTETVLHSFPSGSGDGSTPEASLVNLAGTLYGTTYGGGANDVGTVFSITPSGTETVLHSFASKRDGALPYAGLLNVKGTLYGTTNAAGAKNEGTVFSITTSGKEAVLHSFGGSGDGTYPSAGLINVNGTLYGTTSNGGSGSCFLGCGTVFAIKQHDSESVLYNFQGSSDGDGSFPDAGLIDVKGTLYGTTSGGGASHEGTVFSITTSGKEAVLHSFGGSGDGTYPAAGLLNVNGSLYGTTYGGGANGYGTVFSLRL